MKSLNRLQLIGHVGRDPECRTTQAGTRLARFSVATNRKTGDGETTDWHECVAFGKLADIVEQYVRKGERVYLEGPLTYHRSEAEDGSPRFYTNVVVDELNLLGARNGRER